MKQFVKLFTNSLLSIFLLVQCAVEEATNYGDWYVTNNTSEKILLTASALSHVEVQLQVDQINAGEKAHIYTAVDGTGGHVKPSNSFEEFIIYSGSIAPPNIIYSGVNNDDWIFEGYNDELHQIYNLTIV